MQAHRRPLFVGLSLAAALSLAACGGGGGSADGMGEVEGVSAVDGLGGQQNADTFEGMYKEAVDEGQTTLSVYTPLAATWPHVFEAFQERFPEIQVEPLQIVGAELDTRVNQEAASGQRIADLVITGDTGAVGLAESGLFVEHRPFNASDVTEDARVALPGGELTAVSASPRGFVYDTRQDLPVPTSWEDLLDPALKGRIAMTQPTTDGGGMQWADLVVNTDGLGEEYLRLLADQDVQFAGSTAECHNAVLQGRSYVCIMGAMGNYLTLSSEGAPVDITYPVEGGNWATYWYAGVLDGAPNAKAAELFVAWLNSPEANEVKAAAGHGFVANGDGVQLDFENPTEVDLFDRPDLAEVADRQKESRSVFEGIF